MTISKQQISEYLSESMSPSTVRRGAFRYLLPARGFAYLSEDVMEMKVCTTCKQKKSLELFYKKKLGKYGRQAICIECSMIYARSDKAKESIKRYFKTEKGNKALSRYRKSEKAKERYRRYYLSEHGKKTRREYKREYRKLYPLKVSARKAVLYALSVGKLERGPCEVCGITGRVHGHHKDYSKGLEVNWLCSRHHRDLHVEINS